MFFARFFKKLSIFSSFFDFMNIVSYIALTKAFACDIIHKYFIKDAYINLREPTFCRAGRRRMIKHYIFDFDGTLADSMPYLGQAVKTYLDEQCISYGDDLIEKTMPLGLYGIAKYFIERYGVKAAADEIYEWFLKKLCPEYDEKIPLKPHALALIAKLRSGGATCDMLTASPHSIIDKCAERNGVRAVLRHCWTVEDFGDLKKNGTQIYFEVARRLGAKLEECALLDDNIEALTAAKNAGFAAIGVYDEFSKNTEEKIRAFADKYIYDFAELI